MRSKVWTIICPSLKCKRWQLQKGAMKMKIVLAIDGSSYSEYAVKTVAERLWPSNTTVRFLTVIQDIPPPASELWYDDSGSLERVNQELEKRAEGLVKNIAISLKPSGLNGELALRHGD